MFNSPLQYCPHCKEYVALDQTQPACAAEHHCELAICPLQKYFIREAPKPEPKAGTADIADSRTGPKKAIEEAPQY